MRGNVREAVRVIAERLSPPGPVLEIGALQVPDQPYPANLRPFFAGRVFVGCDLRGGQGVDCVGDLAALPFPSGAIGTALVMETLEHVEDPLRGMAEIRRLLAPAGIVVISACMDFPVHEHPADYWRFTPGGFELLLRGFPQRRIYLQGNPIFPHTLLGIAAGPAWRTDLAILDPALAQVHGTLTQEISPRLAPDPFRPLGAPLSESERAKYPHPMLHVAYHFLAEREDELARLRASLSGHGREVRRRKQ